MYRILKNIVDGSVERTLPRTESRGVTELEHMPFHRGNQGILVRTCRQAGHGIKTVHPEQVPDHRVRRGTKPGIPDRSLVIYSLYRSDGRGGDTLAGDAGRDDWHRREGPADPWCERTGDFSNGLKTMMVTDAADRPSGRMTGERFSPSQVCSRGNSRKSSETLSGFMDTSMDGRVIKGCFRHVTPSLPAPAIRRPSRSGYGPANPCADPRIFIVS
jgi:hypothetical protein